MKFLSTAVLSFSMLISLFAHSQQEFGKASYIDLAYQGGKTASGETYDGNQFTAAHKVHPFGTRLKVTRQDNGRSVIVRVNDRGPYIKGRIIDLSYAAAKALDMVRDGIIDVNIEVLSKGATSSTASTPPSTRPTESSTDLTASSSTTPSTDNATTNTQNSTNSNNDNTTTPGIAATSNDATPPANTPEITQNGSTDYGDRLLTDKYEKFGLYEIKILQVNKAGYGVQIASLSSYENAMKQLTELQGKKINNALLSIEQKDQGGMAFKVIVGPYTDRNEAKKQAARLKRVLKVSGFVVDLGTINY